MSYERKHSKFLIGEFCSSVEFNNFKNALELLNSSIEETDIKKLLKSIESIEEANKKIFLKVNTMLMYTLEEYLTDAQKSNIEMCSTDEGVALRYKHYLPSYISDQGLYTSIDTTLMTIDFKNRKILVKDISKEFDVAEKCKKNEHLNESIKVESICKQISDMENNRENSAYVINKINHYNKEVIKNKTFEKLKCKFSKNVYAEYLVLYDELLNELKEQSVILLEDYKKVKFESYLDKKLEVTELQKGLLRSLMNMNYMVNYENEEDEIIMVKNPIDIRKIYNV